MPRIDADLIIHHAKQVVTIRGHSQRPAIAEEMEDLSLLENAGIAIRNRRIIAVGKSGQIMSDFASKQQIDATDRVVMPGFVDAHTHLVFCGSRETELELKIKGVSYLEILHEGGGILKTVRETRRSTKSELFQVSKERCERLLRNGTTTIEAKSGYGLTIEDEIKILEVIKELNSMGLVSLVPTFLGAHAIPPEFQGRTSDYVTEVCEYWIPEIAKLHLAEFCDVFCEKNVFGIEDSRRILLAGKGRGLVPKIHADELHYSGGAELAAEVGAISADHLVYVSSIGLSELKRAGVIATLLPAAPLTLMMSEYADARGIISRGIPVALGSDLSPSCVIENYQLVIALACYQLRMTPAEAIVASTINAAHAILRASEIGSIETGKLADILILNAKDYRCLGYQFGSDLVNMVIKGGRILVTDGRINTKTE